ncbi:hypothetical protein [Telluribacter sp. SYSU D00476]|uniref:hypothetical protein n=1 Tax=Telluribacter sp. SYSU D00476 TaxID=2811430 RepID=UPI001FF127D1|nr:hypothetical protein [Telluribacter sp. SYSU D00476]
MKPNVYPTWKAVANGLSLCFFLGCSPGAGPEPEFVPNLSQLWHDSVDNGVTFKHWITWSYFPNCPTPAPCKNEGYFTGSDSYRQGNVSSSCSMAGYFKNHHIEWFYPESIQNSDCPIKGASFKGTINDESNLITVKSPTLGDLVLRKN